MALTGVNANLLLDTQQQKYATGGAASAPATAAAQSSTVVSLSPQAVNLNAAATQNANSAVLINTTNVSSQSLNSAVGQALNQAMPYHEFQPQFQQNLNPYQAPQVPAVQVWPVQNQPVQTPPPPGIQLVPGLKQGGHINTYV